MSNSLTQDNVIIHKKHAIKKLNKMMEFYLNSNNYDNLKKVNLLSYWFEQYSDYILNEQSYSPLKQISYTRGDVVKVNFGFRVGKEYGGLHFAIVLDKNNPHSMHTLTVVPLTSGSADKVHQNDVYLGTELASILYEKNNNTINKCRKEIQKLQGMLDLIKSLQITTDNTSTLYNQIVTELNSLNHDIENIKKDEQFISKMKSGSIALINQITTIDKARIYTPRKAEDLLYHVRFSTPKMDQINEAIKKQFIF